MWPYFENSTLDKLSTRFYIGTRRFLKVSSISSYWIFFFLAYFSMKTRSSKGQDMEFYTLNNLNPNSILVTLWEIAETFCGLIFFSLQKSHNRLPYSEVMRSRRLNSWRKIMILLVIVTVVIITISLVLRAERRQNPWDLWCWESRSILLVPTGLSCQGGSVNSLASSWGTVLPCTEVLPDLPSLSRIGMGLAQPSCLQDP